MPNPNRDRWNDPKAKRFRSAVANWHRVKDPVALEALIEAGKRVVAFHEHNRTLEAMQARLDGMKGNSK